MTTQIQADYLIVGAGAMGMAFADSLVSESDATVAIVDRYHQPGGHWNIAYPFVRLHQPSAFYGVNSRTLGNHAIDRSGTNAGLYELASGGEVTGYFGSVLTQELLPTGRVQYFPRAEYDGPRTFRSLVTGERFEVQCRKVVDATYLNVNVPAMRAPSYALAADIRCVAPNALVDLVDPPEHYSVVGGGKTGMDVCLWLLSNGVPAERLRWFIPRDPWLLDRARIQPGPQFVEAIVAGQIGQARAIAEATDARDLLRRLGECGSLLRLSHEVEPSMYRCATVSHAELAELRRITDIVRMGRIKSITSDTVELDDGTLAAQPGTMYIDCSADGLERRPPLPVFDDDRITLQSVRMCQQVFSAALIGYLETRSWTDAQKNQLCTPVPHPDSDIDWLRVNRQSLINGLAWAENHELSAWLAEGRIDWFGRLGPEQSADPAKRAEDEQANRARQQAQARKIEELLAQYDAAAGVRNGA